MSVWACIGFSTEEHGDASVRHREYTTSARKAEQWNEIERIDFTDSGHGIVFSATPHRGPRAPERRGLRDHVERELKRLRAADRAEYVSIRLKRSAAAQLREFIADFEDPTGVEILRALDRALNR